MGIETGVRAPGENSITWPERKSMESENFQRHLRFSRSITCHLVVSETKHHVAMKNQELYVIFIKEIKLWETPQLQASPK